jgi:hypothetical protein
MRRSWRTGAAGSISPGKHSDIPELRGSRYLSALRQSSRTFDAKGWQAVVPLIGYVDRFSARPGERIAVKVSSPSEHPYRADLMRIIQADADPAGPGIKFEEIGADFAGTYVSRYQPVHLGSCGVVITRSSYHAP